MTDDLRELGRALLSHIDALMPDIQKAIGAKWDRGDYFNGPQFAATLDAFRAWLAPVDTDAMIRAGREYLLGFGIDDMDDEEIAGIYTAMSLASVDTDPKGRDTK